MSSYEEKLRLRNGEILWVELKAIPYYQLGEDAALIIIYDISERKRREILEENLQRQKKLLEESEEYAMMKTEYFNNLTHELRTP
nr:PAS domain S-box protein [Alkaliphilus serpentinus]